MALDPKTHNLYLTASEFDPPGPPPEKQPHPQPGMKPGSLGLSVTANGPLRCTYTRCGEPSNFASTRCINPPTLTKPTGYAHVVIARGPRTIYIAGQTATDKDGNVVGPGDFRAQANQIFENLRAALGAGFDDIVNLNIYVLDMTNAPAMREVRADYLASNPPAAMLVEVKKLARDDFMLEIEAIAVTAK